MTLIARTDEVFTLKNDGGFKLRRCKYDILKEAVRPGYFRAHAGRTEQRGMK